MTRVLHIRANETRRMPWKNGRGMTEELALWPARSTFERGDFDWRISKASVVEAGPFSLLAEFERILVVVAGDALVLAHDDRAPRARLRRFEPYSFSGAWPTHAELPSGPIDDFNVFTRRGRVRAEVQTLALARRRSRENVGAEHLFVHVLAGAAHARVSGEEAPFELGAAENLWIQEARAGDEIELSGTTDDTVVIVVRVAHTRA